MFENESLDPLHTPLATAIGLSDVQEVKRILFEERAAESVFVKGSGSNSILCTLPNAPKPQSSVMSHKPPLQDISEEIVDTIDSSVCSFLNSLPVEKKSLSDTNEDAKKQFDTVREGYRIGDIVRLAPEVTRSSLVDQSNPAMAMASDKCLGDVTWGRFGVIAGNSSRTDHSSGSDGFLVKEAVFGGQFRYLESDITYGDSSTPDTVFTTGSVKLPSRSKSSKSQPAQPILQFHDYVSGQCKICTSCAYCTGYYRGCCMCGAADRSSDKGKACGCGQGKSGCNQCGMCDQCGGQGQTCRGAPPTVQLDPGVLAINLQWISASENTRLLSNLLTSDPVTMWSGSAGSHMIIHVPSNATSTLCTMEVLPHKTCSTTFVTVSCGSSMSDLKPIKTTCVKAGSDWLTLIPKSAFRRLKIDKTPRVIHLSFSSQTAFAEIRLRDVAMSSSPEATPLVVGDRVCLSDTMTDPRAASWCLGKDGTGTVICSPSARRTGGEQKGVIVRFEDPSTSQVTYSVYRSSWLVRSSDAPVFAVGDRVRLNPGAYDAEVVTVANKCLGSPSMARYGIVCAVGAVRNGVQRNVEVVCPQLISPSLVFNKIDWEQVCEGQVDAVRSLYPSAVLAPAERCVINMPGDTDHMKTVIREHIASADRPSIDTDVLVDKFALEVWSVLSPALGSEKVLEIFRDWSTRFASYWPKENSCLKESRLGTVCFESREAIPVRSDCDEHKHGNEDSKREASFPDGSRISQVCTSWKCDTCLYSGNGSDSSKCKACGEKGKRWACLKCQKVNKVTAFQCLACSHDRGELDIQQTVVERQEEMMIPEFMNSTTVDRDLSVLFDKNSSTSIHFTDRQKWVEFVVPGDRVLESLEIYVEGDAKPTWIRIVGIPVDVFKKPQLSYCRNPRCHFIPNRNIKNGGFCCSKCTSGEHSVSCPSSCRKKCSIKSHKDLCRLCKEPMHHHSGPSNHTCADGSVGVFSHFTAPISRVQQHLKTLPGFQHDVNLPETAFGWNSLLTEQSCGMNDYKSVWVSFPAPRENGYRVTGLRMKTRHSVNVSSFAGSSWRCPSCFDTSTHGTLRKIKCPSCKARFPTKPEAFFTFSDFLEMLSISQRNALRAQVTFMAYERDALNPVLLEEDDDVAEDAIIGNKWAIEGVPTTSQKRLTIDFHSVCSGNIAISIALCLEKHCYVLYAGRGKGSAKTRFSYVPDTAKWTLAETREGLLLLNESNPSQKLVVPCGKVDGISASSGASATEVRACRGEEESKGSGYHLMMGGSEEIYPSTAEPEDGDSSDEDESDDDTETENMDFEVSLNALISNYVDMGYIPIPESISGSSETLRMQSVFFWSTSALESFEHLQKIVTARDRDHNTSAHLAAYCGLRRTTEALFANGASRWSMNKKGHTPMGLLHGLSGGEHVFKLHKLCLLGNFFAFNDMDSVNMPMPLALRCFLHCPGEYDVPAELRSILDNIVSGDGEEALECLCEYSESEPHFGVLKALAALYSGYGIKTCAVYLSNYVDNIVELSKGGNGGIFLSPLYFFVRYSMWKFTTGPEASSKEARKSAAYALQIVREFPSLASRVLSEEDNIDEVMDAELFPDEENSDDDDQSVDNDVCEELAPDAPENEWIIARERHGVTSTSMDKLMGLVGVKNVKAKAMAVVKEVLLAPLRPEGLKTETCMNFLFTGNPGCGKTTVATLLSAAMVEVGFRSTPDPVLTNAGKILSEKDPVAYFTQLVDDANGGTLFIDEAYQFNPAPRGSQANESNKILDYLLKVTVTMRDTTTFILAGYKDQILDLLTYNDGFRSRFPKEFTFEFEDYNEFQLRKIFCDMVKDRGFKLEPKRLCGCSVSKVIARRMARGAGKRGFGNARHVRTVLDTIVIAHTSRLGTKVLKRQPVSAVEHNMLLKKDCIGDPPDLDNSPLLRELDSMIGLEKVKYAVHGLMELQKQNYMREMRGEYPELISLHRVFFGNPGTGKTTVARIYGALLKEFGFLSNGDLISVVAADLIGDAVGVANTKTAAILESARGKVLFVDEAYVLDPMRRGGGEFGGSVLDTIVDKIEGAAGSDMAVIFAGYEKEMNALFRNCGNPGLKRRFNLSEALRFEDFTESELLSILKRNITRCGLIVDPVTAREVTRIVAQGRRLDGFGNAGAVESIVNRAKTRKSSRISEAQAAYREAMMNGIAPTSPLPHQDILILSDFIAEETTVENAKAAFADLSCAEFLLAAIDTFASTAAAAKADGLHPSVILSDSHMIFYGPPGTGKTEAAKRFGKALFNLELLPRDSVVCVTGQNLQGQHIGSTPGVVYETMQKAKGGILFIDEAYALIPKRANYGEEAILALLDNMTKDEFKGNLLVILAGYENHIEDIFKENIGLRTRFDKMRIRFTAWTAQNALDCTIRLVIEDNKTMTDGASDLLLKMYELMTALPDWASAREVREVVIPTLYMARAVRLRNASRAISDDPAANASKPKIISVLNKMGPTISPYVVDDVIAVFEKNIQHRCNGNTRDMFRRYCQVV